MSGVRPGRLVNAMPTLALDAAMVLGIASTAMPFARTPEAQAERWLRILRLHGEAGAALQALGVGEGPLPAQTTGAAGRRTGGAAGVRIESAGGSRDEGAAGGRTETAVGGGSSRGDDRDMVGQVTAFACRIASERGEEGVTTTDVLLAVLRVYGEHFDRVLQAYGTDRDEVIRRLGVKTLAA